MSTPRVLGGAVGTTGVVGDTVLEVAYTAVPFGSPVASAVARKSVAEGVGARMIVTMDGEADWT